jgi:hypothetical protein
MVSKLTRFAVLLGWGAGAVLAVFGYNLWSYCCGHCTARTFLNPGMPGYGLLLLIAAAAATFALLKRRTRRTSARSRCSCGFRLQEDWLYCPECGWKRA